MSENACVKAARSGNLEELKRIANGLENPLEEKHGLNKWVTSTAAFEGHFHVVKWAHEQGCPIDENAFLYAVWGNHIDIMDYLKEYGHQHLTEETCLHSFDMKDPETEFKTIQWLRRQNPPCPWDAQTFQAAACSGHIPTLEWLRGNGCPWDKEACSMAARWGHLHVLKWLRENGCEWDCNVITYAIKYGHGEVEEWAKNNGCPTPQ